MLRQWLQECLLNVLVQGVRGMSGLRVYPTVADITQPFANFCVGGGGIDDQPAGPHPALQRHVEVVAQVAMEAFHLTLGASAIRTAQTLHEAVQLGHVQEIVVPAMLAFAVAVALDHNTLGIVVQDLSGHPAQCVEQRMVAGDQRSRGLVGCEAYPTPPAVPKGGCERIEWIMATPEHDEIALHLLVGRDLKTLHRVLLGGRFAGTQ